MWLEYNVLPVHPSVCLYVTYISSHSFEARELRFGTHNPNPNATKHLERDFWNFVGGKVGTKLKSPWGCTHFMAWSYSHFLMLGQGQVDLSYLLRVKSMLGLGKGPSLAQGEPQIRLPKSVF